MCSQVVKYNGNIILTGVKDPTTDLWALPITPAAININGTNNTSQQLLASPISASTLVHPLVGIDHVDHKREMCQITLILLFCQLMDLTNLRIYPKTSPKKCIR